ncbi:MAG: B12-binding domain-containing radical SAM protein [Candidatus Omnitrophica bacterium]|nr:B12-binding domain-containing radical SAM protein [Candidatus Omnitrophota bacterium]
MKILLIHASISGCGFESFSKGDPTESSWINHGLCSISAYAKKNGFIPELIDLRLLRNWADFKLAIQLKKPDVVGLSMMSVDYNPVMKCAKIIKQCNKNTKIIVGGPHPTIVPEDMRGNQDIDYIITGEGEISFTKLLQGIKEGLQTEKIIPGIKPVLDELPFIDRELYSGHEMPILPELPQPFMTLIAGRGCMYNCSFCQPAERKLFGDQVRRRSADNIIEELKELRVKYGFKSLMIHDDCITEDVNWVERFCFLYAKEGFKAPFVCQSRADLICRNENLIEKMKEAGLYMFIIGFESGNQRILNFLRKGTTVEQNYKAAQICRKYGIKIWANYMMGMPTETKQEVQDTLKMIKEISPDHCSPAFFTPHPGSDLYEYCQKHDLSLIKSHDEYRRNPHGAKIKGVDYKFLNDALIHSLQISKKDHLLKSLLRNKTVIFLKNRIKGTKAGKEIIKGLKKMVYHEK